MSLDVGIEFKLSFSAKTRHYCYQFTSYCRLYNDFRGFYSVGECAGQYITDLSGQANCEY